MQMEAIHELVTHAHVKSTTHQNSVTTSYFSSCRVSQMPASWFPQHRIIAQSFQECTIGAKIFHLIDLRLPSGLAQTKDLRRGGASRRLDRCEPITA